MGRPVLTLLITAFVAVVLGIGGVAAVAQGAVKSSSDAAEAAKGKDLGAPKGYGSR